MSTQTRSSSRGPAVTEPAGRTSQGGTRIPKFPPNSLATEATQGNHNRPSPGSLHVSKEAVNGSKG